MPTPTPETNVQLYLFMKPLFRIIIILLGWVTALEAQWVKQEITLKPGWNAVFLEVHPLPEEADVVFAGLPIESVWDWNRRGAPIQFVQDPLVLVPQLPEWSTWFPAASPSRGLANLFDIPGGRGYLIKLGGTVTVTLQVNGRPASPEGTWAPDSYSLAGFFVKPSGAPSFTNYFAQSPAHAPTSKTPLLIYQMNPLGKWESAPVEASIQPGKAYWVRTRGASTYKGPSEVVLESSAGLHFGTALEESRIVLRNNSSAARTFAIQLLPSAARPATAPTFPEVAGPVLLAYKDFAVGTGAAQLTEWTPFPTTLTLTLAAGQDKVLGLATQRRAMGAPSAIAGVSLFQGVLDIQDSGGLHQSVGVSIGKKGTAAPEGALPQGASQTVSPFAGLWVGSANITGVNWIGGVSPRIIAAAGDAELNAAGQSLGYTPDEMVKIKAEATAYVAYLTQPPPTINGSSPVPTGFQYADKIRALYEKMLQARNNQPLRSRETLLPAQGEFPLRLIIHVGADGKAKLLSKVIQVWERGTTAADPNNPDLVITKSAGHFRLFSAEQSSFAFDGAEPRNGGFVPRRITSTAFSHKVPASMAGSFGTGVLGCGILVAHDDPLNPFLHRFHPHHDGRDLNGKPLPPSDKGAETFTINRTMELEFLPDDPYQEKSPGWGDTLVGGIYKETITGIHKDPLKTSGLFKLRRVSSNFLID